MSLISENKPLTDITTSNEYSVLVFLSPDCPICQSYIESLNTISQNKVYSKQISLYGVFSGNLYSNEEIQSFTINYKTQFPIIIDKKSQLKNQLSANITPEVFVINSQNKVIYSGLIDNWYAEIGKKRFAITKHYLIEVIESIINSKTIPFKKTKAVGCIIE